MVRGGHNFNDGTAQRLNLHTLPQRCRRAKLVLTEVFEGTFGTLD